MTKTALGIITKGMNDLNLKYMLNQYKIRKGETPDLYFVGEYQETEPMNEDGMDETLFVLTGFSRKGISALEEAREKIEKYFPRIEGKIVKTDTGSVAAVYYAKCFNNLSTGNTEITKIQINLLIKEWKV